MGVRPGWTDYFVRITYDVSARATCTRRKFGAVIVDEDMHIVSTGFNGVVRGAPHCLDVGCVKDDMGIDSGMGHGVCPAVHAEMNALLQAGPRARGCTLYVNGYPCKICARLIVNAGVSKVVAWGEYPDKEGLGIMRDSGLEVDVL